MGGIVSTPGFSPREYNVTTLVVQPQNRSLQQQPHQQEMISSTCEYLPVGWQAVIRPEDGKKFYVDHVSRQTHWYPPWLPPFWEMHVTLPARIPFFINLGKGCESQWIPPVPPGWRIEFEPHSGRPYLRDGNTGIAYWVHPWNCQSQQVLQIRMQSQPQQDKEEQNKQESKHAESTTVEVETHVPVPIPEIRNNDTAEKPVVESLICKVCMESQIDIVLLPCGHLCICSKCLQKGNIEKCVICRTEITQTIHVFQT